MEKIIVVLCIAVIIGFLTGILLSGKVIAMAVKEHNQCVKKVVKYYFILNDWLALRQKGETIAKFFEKNKYKRVAVYGMKELGERLIDELEKNGIEVTCIIDQNPTQKTGKIPVISPTDEIPKSDVMVVTASFYFNEIRNRMKDRVDCDIVSMDDVVYSKY